MAGMTSDLDVLKDIPGYKAILKSVLKSQIQLLIEQLSDHTGEEAIILTASIHDGTLSHLGSNTGKGFLDGRDEIKSQFLAYCLKSHHKKKSSDARSSPYQRPQSGQSDRVTPQQGLSHKRPRLQPVSLQRAGAADSPGSSFTPPDIHRAPSQVLSANGQDSSNVNVKLESSEHSVSSTEGTNFVTTSVSLPTSIQLSHTQTSAEPGISDTSEGQNEDSFGDHGSENDDTAATSIKIEPITENEMELEITGVEPGKSSVAADSWSQVPGASSVGDGAVNETGDQTGYRRKNIADTYWSVEEVSKRTDYKNLLSCNLLRIPKLLPNSCHSDDDNELIEREVRNPLTDMEVPVKFEPREVSAVKYKQPESVTDQCSSITEKKDVFKKSEFLGERKYVMELDHSDKLWTKEKIRCSESKLYSKETLEKDCQRWKSDMFHWQWRENDVENTERRVFCAASSSQQKALNLHVQVGHPVSNVDNAPKKDRTEGEWKRTVSLGKPRKQADNKKKIAIKNSVGEIISKLRRQMENQTKAIAVDAVGNRDGERTLDNGSKEIHHRNNQMNDPFEEIKNCKRNKGQTKCFQTKDLEKVSKARQKSKKVIQSSQLVSKEGNDFLHSGHLKSFNWKHNCTSCPMRFATEKALNQHMWRHTKHKPFVCSHCYQGYRRMKQLHQHMYKEHPGLPY